jgi:serine O-acetyltransferase
LSKNARPRLLARYRIVETLTGISIPKSVEIGPGLKIHHFGNIFLHKDAKLGANCTLRQGVTIGNRRENGPVPMLEDDVELGAYAQVLGDVKIGKGAKIGAMSVVLCDVPAGATAIGIPAKVIVKG